MSDDTKKFLEQIEFHASRLSQLVQRPEMGLISWNMAVGEHAKWLADWWRDGKEIKESMLGPGPGMVLLSSLICGKPFRLRGQVYVVTNANGGVLQDRWPTLKVATGELFQLHRDTHVEELCAVFEKNGETTTVTYTPIEAGHDQTPQA